MGECRFEGREAEAQKGAGDQALINQLGTPPRTIAAAEPGSEASRMAQYTSSWIGRNPLPNDPPNSAWTNLRSIQSLLSVPEQNGGPGITFREGFPQSGGVTIEMMERIIGGATHGNDRINEIPGALQSGLKEGDIVAHAAPQSQIGVSTCGHEASLGVVMRDGRVAKFNGGKAQIVAATEFFKQSDVRVFRVAR